MNDDKKILGFYNYTVILTYVGLLCSIQAIMASIGGKFFDAAILLMVSGLCDMFDDTVASTMERTEHEKRFGIQIDSLTDLVSFGIMPAIFVYMIADKHPVAGVITSLYVLAALIRLAYFNVLEEDRQRTTDERRKHIIGVPVTIISVALPIIYLLDRRPGFRNSAAYLILLVVCGGGFRNRRGLFIVPSFRVAHSAFCKAQPDKHAAIYHPPGRIPLFQ